MISMISSTSITSISGVVLIADTTSSSSSPTAGPTFIAIAQATRVTPAEVVIGVLIAGGATALGWPTRTPPTSTECRSDEK